MGHSPVDPAHPDHSRCTGLASLRDLVRAFSENEIPRFRSIEHNARYGGSFCVELRIDDFAAFARTLQYQEIEDFLHSPRGGIERLERSREFRLSLWTVEGVEWFARIPYSGDACAYWLGSHVMVIDSEFLGVVVGFEVDGPRIKLRLVDQDDPQDQRIVDPSSVMTG